jgi:two-component system chemotaxis response regulator CheB
MAGADACRSRRLRPARVPVVDDSPSIRRLLRFVIGTDPDLCVVGEADNPLQARERIKTLDPDVITLDVDTPQMDGLEFLRRLMRLRPTPVVMISALTEAGSDAAVTALSLGAVDVFAKPSGGGSAAWLDLVPILKTAADAVVRPPRPVSVRPPVSAAASGPAFAPFIFAIGASTGGVEALETVLAALPAGCPPVVVVQHMPQVFLESLVRRLDRMTALQVVLAEANMPLHAGTVYLAPGTGLHMSVNRTADRVVLTEGPKVIGHRPSVDVLFDSLACSTARVAACLLMGMGRDGAAGMGALRAAGATTVAQNSTTSVVFGMPRAAIEAGAASTVRPLDQIAAALLAAATDHATETAKFDHAPFHDTGS